MSYSALRTFALSTSLTLRRCGGAAASGSACVVRPTAASMSMTAAPQSATATASAVCVSVRHSSSLSPVSIADTNGLKAVPFTPYKVFVIESRHDPKLRSYEKAKRLAIIMNRYRRVTSAERGGLTRKCRRLNRLRTLHSQRRLLAEFVIRRFGKTNYHFFYPQSKGAASGTSAGGSASSTVTKTNKRRSTKRRAASRK